MQAIPTFGAHDAHSASYLLSLAEHATDLHTISSLHAWLNGEMREVISHEVMIVAWRNLALRTMSVDVLARHSGMMRPHSCAALHEPLQRIFDYWLATGGVPIEFRVEEFGIPVDTWEAPDHILHGLAHGIADQRGQAQCLYIFLGSDHLRDASTRNAWRLLLPFVDAAFRRLAASSAPQFTWAIQEEAQARPRPESADSEVMRLRGLTGREIEIMKWVSMGKTNAEIAIILGLSMFTIKNHMRRIYQKLDVLNRAQAVGCMTSANPVRSPALRPGAMQIAKSARPATRAI